jgi:hypothetical protein
MRSLQSPKAARCASPTCSFLPARPIVVVPGVPSSDLSWLEDARICRPPKLWSNDNQIVHTLWERFLPPGTLRLSLAEVPFCPGGGIATRSPACCWAVALSGRMISFDPREGYGAPFGVRRMSGWLVRVTLRCIGCAGLMLLILAPACKKIEATVRPKGAPGAKSCRSSTSRVITAIGSGDTRTSSSSRETPSRLRSSPKQIRRRRGAWTRWARSCFIPLALPRL